MPRTYAMRLLPSLGGFFVVLGLWVLLPGRIDAQHAVGHHSASVVEDAPLQQPPPEAPETYIAAGVYVYATVPITTSSVVRYALIIADVQGRELTGLKVDVALPDLATYRPGSVDVGDNLMDPSAFPADIPAFNLPAGGVSALSYEVIVDENAEQGVLVTNVITISAPAFSHPLVIMTTSKVGLLEIFLPVTPK